MRFWGLVLGHFSDYFEDVGDQGELKALSVIARPFCLQRHSDVVYLSSTPQFPCLQLASYDAPPFKTQTPYINGVLTFRRANTDVRFCVIL